MSGTKAIKHTPTLYMVILIPVLVSLIVISGCARERPSKNPPIHLNPNMDSQEKYKPQAAGPFFADGAAMRSPVPGTIARGELRDNKTYYRGRDVDGNHIKSLPVEISPQLLQRGRERYDIYCSPCHSRLGDGRGIMIQRGYIPPPTFHTDRIRDFDDGYIFDVITSGVRNMPAYAHQVPVADRWAIVAYIRALQRAQNATVDDVPEELRDIIRQAEQ